MHILQLHLALILSLQFFRKGSRHLIAHGIRNNDKYSGIHIFDTGAIEVLLPGNFQYLSVLCQFIGAHIRPVTSQFAQEPMRIQPLYLVHNVLEQIIQQHIGGFQASLEAELELPVITIHPVIIVGVVLPYITSLCRVETGRVFFEELLHIRHLQDSLIEVGKLLIPDTGAALSHNFRDDIRINDLIADFCHQLCQYDFIDARETLGIHQIFQCQLAEPLRQAGFFLYITGDFIKLMIILTPQPVRHKVIAVCLMGKGQESF